MAIRLHRSHKGDTYSNKAVKVADDSRRGFHYEYESQTYTDQERLDGQPWKTFVDTDGLSSIGVLNYLEISEAIVKILEDHERQ